MKKIKFFLLIIIIIGIISIPLTSIGDVNSYNVVIASRKNEKNSFSKNNIKNEIIDKDNNTSNLIFDFKTLEKYDKHLIYKIKYPVINNKDINFKIS
uniref:hypothetical protein n=1 Tax=uncultured Tyzzerella sp. TaxID=2321398 RepID=UPI002942BE37